MVEIKLAKYEKVETSKLDDAINRAIDKIAPIIIQEAQLVHRYNRQTGNLARATKYSRVGDVAKFYIDEIKAQYGQYIHDGTKKWHEDPFLANAFENHLDDIDRAIIEEVDKII
jgi:HK97 gp10 family phage protein